MAGSLLGDVIDMHSGGVDLQFPHHDNEMAQAEAFFNSKQWVNYFLHSGHLHISGLKMSKSLKNFITIRQVSEENFSRQQLRVLFLLQSWDGTLNYQKENTMTQVDAWLKGLYEFFLKIENSFWYSNPSSNQSWTDNDINLHHILLQTQNEVDEGLKDNFDTPRVMLSLSRLISATNDYISKHDDRKYYLLKKIGAYVTKILKVFGVIEDDFEVGMKTQNQNTTEKTIDQSLLRPYLKALTDFRSFIRETALNNGTKGDYLKQCDNLRDNIMPNLGVRISDDGEFPFDIVDRETLLSENRIKDIQKNLDMFQPKLKTKANDLKKIKDTLSTNIHEHIKESFNVALENDGSFPENDLDGKKVSKNAKKNIAKKISTYEGQRSKIDESLKENPNFLTELEEEVDQLTITILNLKNELNDLRDKMK